MAKEMTEVQRKAHHQGAVEATKAFFEALQKNEDWRPFAQKHYAKWDLAARPLIMAFDGFEVQYAGKGKGMNHDVGVSVCVSLRVAQIGGSLSQRRMVGRIAVWCEEGPMKPSVNGTWGVAPQSFQVNEGMDNLDV